MKRFKNILYFADGATRAGPGLARALELAEANRARLTVIDVIEEHPADPELDRRLGAPIDRLLRDRRLEQVTEMLVPHQRDDRVIYTQVLAGIPFVEVIRAVQRNDFDLLVKEARPAGGLAERLLGSTDLHLLRKCPCPVWIDRPEKPVPYRNILAAVDPMRAEGEARLVMDLATSLATATGAELQVLHAWQLVGESLLLDGLARVSRTEIDLLLDYERDRHRQQLDRILAPYGLHTGDPRVRFVKAIPSEAVLSAAEGADLIVMGTVGRTGIPGLFVGDTAEEVMQNTRTSILAVKPDGFRSPLD
jgi:universal stress protein E